MNKSCCGWWWCFSLAFVDEKKMPLSRLRPLFLPLTSMMIHHPSLSQHEFHGHYGWIPMDMYCILSILNFPAKSSVHSKYILQSFWIHSDTLEYIWIHFSWIWILFFLKYFEYFWIHLIRFPRDIWTFTSEERQDHSEDEDPPYLLESYWNPRKSEKRSYPHLLPQKRGQLVFIGRERV